jgi:hypothetical protein
MRDYSEKLREVAFYVHETSMGNLKIEYASPNPVRPSTSGNTTSVGICWNTISCQATDDLCITESKRAADYYFKKIAAGNTNNTGEKRHTLSDWHDFL